MHSARQSRKADEILGRQQRSEAEAEVRTELRLADGFAARRAHRQLQLPVPQHDHRRVVQQRDLARAAVVDVVRIWRGRADAQAVVEEHAGLAADDARPEALADRRRAADGVARLVQHAEARRVGAVVIVLRALQAAALPDAARGRVGGRHAGTARVGVRVARLCGVHGLRLRDQLAARGGIVLRQQALRFTRTGLTIPLRKQAGSRRGGDALRWARACASGRRRARRCTPSRP